MHDSDTANSLKIEAGACRKTDGRWIPPVLVLFAIGIAILMVWIPFDAARVQRAIPPSVSLISRHYMLADQLDDWLENELIQAALTAGGVDVTETREFLDSFWGGFLLRVYGGRLTYLAVLPGMQPGGPPMVLLSGWGGWLGQVLRWIAELGVLPDIDKVRCSDGRLIWQWRQTVEWGGYELRLTAAFTDGVALLCLSEDGLGLEWIRRRIERGVPSGVPDKIAADTFPQPGGAAADTHVWWRIKSDKIFRWADFGLLLEGNRIHLMGSVPELVKLESGVAKGEALGALLHGDVHAAVLMPAGNLDVLAGFLPDSAGQSRQVISNWTKSNLTAHQPLALALCGGKRSGRIFGLRVPSLLLAMPSEAGDGVARMWELIDGINQATGLGLVMYPDPTAPELQVIGTTGDQGLFTEVLPIHERPVFTQVNDYLLLMTARSALNSSAAVADDEHWSRQGPDEGLGVFWIDLDETARVLKHVVAVVRLAGMTSRSDSAQQAGMAAAEISPWLDSFQGLGTIRAQAHTVADKWHVYLVYESSLSR